MAENWPIGGRLPPGYQLPEGWLDKIKWKGHQPPPQPPAPGIHAAMPELPATPQEEHDDANS